MPAATDAERRLDQIRRAARIAVIGCALLLLSDAVTVLSMHLQRRLLLADAPAWADLDAIGAMAAAAAVLGTAGLAAPVAVGFMVARLFRLAAALHLPRTDHGMGWTVATLYLPIVVLWRPWQGLSDVRGAIALAAGTQPSAGPGDPGPPDAPREGLGTAGAAFALAWLAQGAGALYGMRVASAPKPNNVEAWLDLLSRAQMISALGVLQALVLGAASAWFAADLLRLGRAAVTRQGSADAGGMQREDPTPPAGAPAGAERMA